jgi:FkbM family methyltransferase
LQRGLVAAIRRLPIGRGFAFRLYRSAISRIAPGPIETRTTFGARLVCDPRDSIQRRILQFGVWEPDVTHLIQATLKPGDVFVDVGANIGYDTLLGSSLVGPSGRVIAVEASPSIADLLRKHVAMNRADNVTVVHAAVSDAPGELTVYFGNAGNIGSTTTVPTRGQTASEAKVRALPLDEIVHGRERDRVKLIKMDIEGAEPTVLRRLLSTLHLYPETMQIIVEVTPADDPNWPETFDDLLAAGFKAYLIENRYDDQFYLGWRRASPLRALEAMPNRRLSDVLFTRQAPPVLV